MLFTNAHHPPNKGVILAVCNLSEDQAKLRSIFASPSWELHQAGSCAEAATLLQMQPISVVICEASLPDGTWRDLLEFAASLGNPPRLIVSSHQADDRLWAEALNVGAHNVLSMPFQATEVCRTLNLAWREWFAAQSARGVAVA